MTRATCLAAAILLTAAANLSAQTSDRNSRFGRSEAEWCRDSDADYCEVREETLKGLTSVDIDARSNGSVSVRGWDRDEVHVRVRITARARTDEEAKALAKETQLVTTGGRIRTDGPRTGGDRGDWSRREWWAASYEVEVPRSTHLTADATNGGIVVDGVRGSVDAETTNGGVSFYDVGGDIRGRATNGGINVELSGDKFQGAGVDVQTTNGAVRVTLPSNFSAELDARVANGGLSVDFPLTMQGVIDTRREIHGTIGSGGPPIRARTTNGGIRIMKR